MAAGAAGGGPMRGRSTGPWSDGGAVEEGIRRQQRRRNGVQTALLLGGLGLLPPGIAWLLFGTGGLVWMLIAVAVLLVVRPRVPTEEVLTTYGAQRLPRWAAPELHGLVDVLAERAGLSA